MRLALVGFVASTLWGLPAAAQSSRVVATVSERSVGLTRVSIDVTDAPLISVLQTLIRQAGLNDAYERAVIPQRAHVTAHLRDVPIVEALQEVLKGTGLTAQIERAGDVFIVRAAQASRVVGILVGRVTDAKTKQPLRGVTVELNAVEGRQGSSLSTATRDDGTYRLTGIPVGERRVSVKLLGYIKQTRTITVTDEQQETLDVALEAGVNTLEQVVVTGMVVPTELKAVPSAITVITAKDIEQRGITHIDQLFRGDVPGLFAQNQGSSPNALLDEVTMFSRGATALSDFSAGTLIGTNPIKTYVDGVELADPKYLSQIDPRSIERIEILTGPQASTIYGSNAMNGVMQVFTKRGTSNTPQLTLNLLSGFVQNNFSNALTPQHDYSAQLSGVEGHLSYNAGGSWNYMGPWTPAKQLARLGGFGGARLELPTPVGRVTSDVTLRRSGTQSLQRGAVQQSVTGYRETGWYRNVSASGLDSPTTRALTGQTLGLTLSYVPTAWWSHEMGMGQDVSDTEQRYTMPGYTSIDDTTLLLQQLHTDRRSLHYVTTARVSVTSFAQATVTAGADAWQTLASQVAVSPQTLTGTLIGSTGVTRQPDHNTGSFLQTQVGLNDRLFFTYGVRAEWNPGYGADAQPNYAPRYGVAYTQEMGPLTAKLRGSYGRSTRPPQPRFKAGKTIADAYGASWSSVSSFILPYFGIFDSQLANPDLAPEYQQGGEGGLELYLGMHGSLVVTRYNQTVDGLIALPNADSARSFIPCPPSTCRANSFDADGYGYWWQEQYVNLGSIRNQGWELQGSVNTGPLTTKGTYSWTKSRTLGVNPRYRAYFANDPQYTPGATFEFLPEHTWALGVTYAHAGSSVGINVTGVGRATNDRNEFYAKNIISSIRLPQNRFNVTFPPYVTFNTGYALADLTASQHFTSHVEGLLQVQNLADRYTNDANVSYAALGRQTKLGLRLR